MIYKIFQDLMDALATLNAATPRSNAVWAIRMMKGCDDTRVDFQVCLLHFQYFIQIYELTIAKITLVFHKI